MKPAIEQAVAEAIPHRYLCPASPLNGTIGSRRRYAIGRGSLLEAKDLKHTLGVSVNDAPTLVAAVLTIALAGLLAGVAPAWRATRIEPAAALRHE